MTRPKHVENLVDDAIGIEPRLGIHRRRTIVIDEDIRQHHAAELEPRALECSGVAEQLHHVRAEATNGAFLDCDKQFVLGRELQDEFSIKWFGKARIGNGYGNPMRRQCFRRLDAFGKPCAKREQGDRVASCDDPAFSDLERHAHVRHRDAHTIAARITQGTWPVVYRDSGCHQVNQPCYIGGCHDYEVWQATKIAQVERAGMRQTVGTGQTCTIHHESHRQLLYCHIVDDLVVGTLKKCRINGDEWLVALGCQACGESNAMLLGYPDVEGAVRERLGEDIDAGTAGHGGCNGNNLVVFLRLLHEAFAEHLRVRWCVRNALLLFSRCDVEFDDAM